MENKVKYQVKFYTYININSSFTRMLDSPKYDIGAQTLITFKTL